MTSYGGPDAYFSLKQTVLACFACTVKEEDDRPASVWRVRIWNVDLEFVYRVSQFGGSVQKTGLRFHLLTPDRWVQWSYNDC